MCSSPMLDGGGDADGGPLLAQSQDLLSEALTRARHQILEPEKGRKGMPFCRRVPRDEKQINQIALKHSSGAAAD